MLNAQQGQNIEVLASLRHDAVVGGHDQNDAIHAAGAGDHRLDKVFVAGHIDNAHLHVGDAARGKAKVDRHTPLFLLLEPVGFTAGQISDQGRLAVVNVAGRAQGDVDLRQVHY